MRLRRSRAISSVMPAFRWTSIWPRPLPTVLGSSALNSVGDNWRRAAFSRKTCSAAFARSSLAASMRRSSSRRSEVVWVSLKSYLVLTSRRAWSRALVSSAGSNSEVTSNENSATRMHDGVDALIDGGRCQHEPDKGSHDHERPDPGSAFIERLEGRLVVRVGSIVEVVDIFRAGALHEIVQDRLAARRQLLGGQVRDGLAEVVASPSELSDDHVEGLGVGRRRVLPPQVRDDPVQAHIDDSFTRRSTHPVPLTLRPTRGC